MRKLLLAAVTVAALSPVATLAQTAAAPAAAPASAPAADCAMMLSPDTMMGKTVDEVKAKLTAMGYEIKKAEGEDDKIEVYFVKDKAMGEVYVSPETGMITKMSYETE